MPVQTLDISEAAAHAIARLRDSYVSTQPKNSEFRRRHPGATPGKVIVIVPTCVLSSLGLP
jgi:hypothetical protein